MSVASSVVSRVVSSVTSSAASWAVSSVVVRVVVVAITAVLAAPGVAAAEPPPCLRPPVVAPVVDGFRAPPCRWCPGNRGLTYAVRPGTPVRAAAAGTVTFAGRVAGPYYLVLQHADGLRATYGGLAGSTLGVGDSVAAGAVVGRAVTDVHFGLRRGDRYVDPTALLGRLVPRPRLVPTDGTQPRPGPPPRLACPVTPAARPPTAG